LRPLHSGWGSKFHMQICTFLWVFFGVVFQVQCQANIFEGRPSIFIVVGRSAPSPLRRIDATAVQPQNVAFQEVFSVHHLILTPSRLLTTIVRPKSITPISPQIPVATLEQVRNKLARAKVRCVCRVVSLPKCHFPVQRLVANLFADLQVGAPTSLQQVGNGETCVMAFVHNS